MTTQQEVAEAFFNGETEPSRASNFEIVEDDNGYRYLIGNGRAVFAVIEPIRQLTFYDGFLRDFHWNPTEREYMSRGRLRIQRRNVRRGWNSADPYGAMDSVDEIGGGVPNLIRSDSFEHLRDIV